MTELSRRFQRLLRLVATLARPRAASGPAARHPGSSEDRLFTEALAGFGHV